MATPTSTYFIYPPWASYSFAWPSLPHIFPFPEKYALGAGPVPLAVPGRWPAEMKKYADLGYSVSARDQRFIDGPEGGGLIAVSREVRRWFPMVLMIPQCNFVVPPGFDRHTDYGVVILVPNVRAAHRLGETAVPLAPSPLFSVEHIEGNALQAVFALGFDGKTTQVDVASICDFPALDIAIKPLADIEEYRDAFGGVEEKGRYYAWYRILYPGEDVRALTAVAIYIGLGVAARANGSLRTMHLFSTRFLAGMEYPSATRWQQSVRRIRKATDW